MHMFRAMIYTIVKLKREHKIIIHINMGVPQILYMYVISLIIIAYSIMSIKT